jgi:T5SS/PEP-CTERM-associated repeat protein
MFMNKMMNRRLLLLFLGIGNSVLGYNNPIDGGITEVVTNAYQAQVPWYIVGGNDEANSLVITDAGQVDNLIGYIGHTISSSNNSALVNGSGAEWNSSMELSIGREGSGNALTVANGGEVDTAIAYVGYNSDNNSATVEDAGSLLDATTLYVGHIGDGNSLTVNDGGRVESTTASIGYWISSDNNSAIVQGSTSVWSNAGILNVGEYGSGNHLAIADGGRVESSVVNVGVQSISSNNTISVSGNGALLDTPELNIGGTATTAGGIGNRVEVQNGGTVATTDLTIHAGNNLDLNNGGTFAINNNFDASMSGFNFNSGGTLQVGGELVGMGSAIEDRRTIVMDGTSAVWDKSGSSLYVGQNSAGNSMIITNGGFVESDSGYIGYESGANGNSVLVAGDGSVWHNHEALYLGGHRSGTNRVAGGTGNSLTVEGGGLVLVGDVDTNNLYRIAQSGSIVVGDANGSAEMVVANGSTVSSGRSAIGLGTNESGVVIVSGEGSAWELTGALPTLPRPAGGLIVGLDGSNSRLVISNGGRVASSEIWYDRSAIGFARGSSNNLALVTGEGSVWDMDPVREIPMLPGGTNILAPRENGMVRSEISYTGPSITSQPVVISFFDGFAVGNSGSGNQLIIEDGGVVRNRKGAIGLDSSASSNLVVVTGGGSMWQNRDSLYLGGMMAGTNLYNGGIGNSLAIQDGGWVLVGDVDTNNLPNIGMAGGLVVGDASGNAELVAANDSLIDTGYAYIGLAANESGSVTLTSGTQMDVRNKLYVGYAGDGSTMTVSDGATLNTEASFIGLDNTASNNVMNVAGGSWNNNDDLYVGYAGSGNELNITDGGKVNSRYAGYIGRWSIASNNSVSVSGGGSVLSNGLSMYVKSKAMRATSAMPPERMVTRLKWQGRNLFGVIVTIFRSELPGRVTH